jgi:hypothetical protein
VPEEQVPMNDRGIMRVSKDQLAEMIDETDWAKVAAIDRGRYRARRRQRPLPAIGRMRVSSGRGHGTRQHLDP